MSEAAAIVVGDRSTAGGRFDDGAVIRDSNSGGRQRKEIKPVLPITPDCAELLAELRWGSAQAMVSRSMGYGRAGN